MPYYQPTIYPPQTWNNQNYMYGQTPSIQNYQMPQVPQVKPMSGRYVNSIEEITANEIAMDGSISLFPKSDLSEIYGKAWKSDGTIQTVIFKPVSAPVEAPQNNADDFSEYVKNSFQNIENKIDQLEKSLNKGVEIE